MTLDLVKRTNNYYFNSFFEERLNVYWTQLWERPICLVREQEKKKGWFVKCIQGKTELIKNGEPWPVKTANLICKAVTKIGRRLFTNTANIRCGILTMKICGHALNNVIHHTSARGSHVRAIYHHHITRLSKRGGELWLLTSGENGFIASSPQSAARLCPKQNAPRFTSA